jgi:hypothetical protein
MLALVVVVGITLGLSHWLVEPLIGLLTPLLTLAWVGWGGLLLLGWLFAGASAQGDGAGSGGKRRQSTMLTSPRERSG